MIGYFDSSLLEQGESDGHIHGPLQALLVATYSDCAGQMEVPTVDGADAQEVMFPAEASRVSRGQSPSASVIEVHGNPVGVGECKEIDIPCRRPSTARQTDSLGSLRSWPGYTGGNGPHHPQELALPFHQHQ